MSSIIPQRNVTPPSHRKIVSLLPKWLSHLTSQRLFDGDNVFLKRQEEVLRAKEAHAERAAPKPADGNDSVNTAPSVWSTSYFMPMRSDKAVIAFRKWLDQVAGGRPTYPPGVAPKPLVWWTDVQLKYLDATLCGL
jgi:hypothetical protein